MEKKTSTRLYYLDWLRVLAILTVFVYHTSRLFNVEDWAVKNPTWYPSVEVWNRFATTWMLPLIFVISGASLFYAVGKGSAGTFIKDKALRLLVPVAVCALTHASLQAYLYRLTHGEFSGSYFQYLPNYFLDDFDWQGAHLWYLLALFLFSLILYPLMRWLRGRGQPVLTQVGDFLALPGAVYVLALPTILLSLVCDPAKPATKLYGGWPLLLYLWFTLSGFLIASHDGLQASIQRLRWPSLPLALVLIALAIWQVGLSGLPPFGTPRFDWGFGLRGLSSWCFVVAILGFGRKHLNFSTPFLTYANEAVLPFYILHQTVILAVGYFVVQWAIPDLLKWLIIVPTSFILIMVLYEFLVRRYNVMRVLFGMKPRPKAPVAQGQVEAAAGPVGTLPPA